MASQEIIDRKARERADIENRFTFHPVKLGTDQQGTYEHFREMAKLLALECINHTPASREQSLALTHLEEFVFWANASVARHT